ncbi:radical SAM domain-containing protein [Candidatus Magnetobacterium bavaricum]|uniref:Radical SAM domain-containing protein n=1 Tax=Candidatus Magnetobacterium bavaricum TaxID=29290 RepID=A0A0F3GJF3_9BACT|nr:radical SAM domain-containing protein [Candidatus Magnetobacterium bavaricum]
MKNKEKVLLYFPDTLENIKMIAPPLSLIALGAYLENKGYDVSIYDKRIMNNAHEKILSELKDALCVGITSLTGPQISDGRELSKKIKHIDPKFPVIWGGWHPSLLPEQTLSDPYVDFIVRGQGEITFLELILALQKKESFESIKGLLFKTGGKIIDNGIRELVDINEFPFLAYHLINVLKYPGRPSSPNDVYTTIRTQQGCPYRCEFCADPIVYKRKMVRYTPERTVDEIEKIVNAYGITEISFQDPTFILSIKHLSEFCTELINRRIKIKWTATARYTSIANMDDEILSQLKDSGCHILHPGVEAASQEMMDYIKKDQRLEPLMICAEKLAKYKINGLYSFIVGIPGEPKGEITKVFNIVKQIKEIDSNAITPVNFYTPYPISYLYRKAIEHGFQEPRTLEEWKDFSARKNNMPWVNEAMEDEVMKKDKYYLPAAYPSEVMQKKMQKGNFRWLYRLFHVVAKFRVKHSFYGFDIDWKLLLTYWRFWGKYNRKLPLHNIHFRW